MISNMFNWYFATKLFCLTMSAHLYRSFIRHYMTAYCHSVSQFGNVINLSGLVCIVIIINM